mmetsp:Transcript_31115/g.66244  ORF Transcript_31115/g.66244 Transcript_31115/m.66244 type:complete len:282 (+) Transcript_31115:240-1085(+)|eukprot:CAMPEP_0172525316 /NCGR_PEP_ID=MMETSP1067-20121228/348_1 /TAXON_ID=265564 ORGANISM="Thalassiosira punctigera, Strain Tpunct2005C2" /NCGR_SAMPLE_ID=MMETSP1067 /ASSEMBLY_ACC=CAM_ASM_000444 /LENGTH=281 /DNA_ID=CAMNT_0013308541 /DNA_START=240 /DNA_END=1085 /DNA_ORIENTATION=+
MSERGRGGEKSDVGEPPTVPAHSSTAAPPASGAEATSIGISSLSLADKTKDPLTPTTPSTLEAATTGTASEHSSEQGIEEVQGIDEVTSLPEQPRQVIAVSVSKGPSAFFNLARKFLVTDEACDLSALEGAIVSAVDAAHLLERSKIATIVRIQTSYVTVEPKKRREHGPSSSITEEASGSPKTGTGATSATTGTSSRQPQALDSSRQVVAGPGPSRINQPGTSTFDLSIRASPGKPKASGGAMRRARIVITVQRTDAYKKWLKENPIQDTHTGQDDDHHI